jgi:flavin reductase (DIM6/NTAB) family NADH-FMN oxidoreductase RutF
MSPRPEAANELFAALDYPMFIVTARDGEERAGCLVGFATQSSIHPPRFLACLSDKNRTYRVARHADVLIVHLVPADRADLAELFGAETGDDTDKFARVDWHDGPGGAPVLEACGNWFAGRILDRFPAGDHVAYLLAPTEAHVDRSEGQFDFHRAKGIAPGHDA